MEKEIRNWPEPAKMQLSDLLALLAAGEMLGMPVSRAMPSVGSSVHELRIKDRSGQYRTFYYLKHKEAILVFHGFKKKTQATPLNAAVVNGNVVRISTDKLIEIADRLGLSLEIKVA